MLKLKSTGQEVYEIPWMATSGEPWTENYTRIGRPFVGLEGINSTNKAESLLVHNDNLITK